jgi:hypothetical protein
MILKPFQSIHRERWLTIQLNNPRFAVFQSEDFTVQCFNVDENVIRLAINRNPVAQMSLSYPDGIDREELKAIIKALGFGDRYGVEIYPPKRSILNVMNVRHLWLLPKSPIPDHLFAEDTSNTHLAWSGWSRGFSLNYFKFPGRISRLSVFFAKQDGGSGGFAGSISWDNLQALKDNIDTVHEGRTAFEIFAPSKVFGPPVDRRDLWLLVDRFAFEWH